MPRTPPNTRKPRKTQAKKIFYKYNLVMDIRTARILQTHLFAYRNYYSGATRVALDNIYGALEAIPNPETQEYLRARANRARRSRR